MQYLEIKLLQDFFVLFKDHFVRYPYGNKKRYAVSVELTITHKLSFAYK